MNMVPMQVAEAIVNGYDGAVIAYLVGGQWDGHIMTLDERSAPPDVRMPVLAPLMSTAVLRDRITTEDMLGFVDVVYERGARRWVGTDAECVEYVAVTP